MANPKIEVEIGAVIDGLRKGFGESVKIIETLEKQALDLDKALKAATDLPTIQNLNSQLAQTKAALAQLRNSGIDPLTKATSNYNSVGTDFARIIQDAPFGIIGVGNNITQLAGSFQVLKSQTGSTGAALKAALGSILSSGNALVLGISILTTGLTILSQQGFFKSEEAAKSLADRLDEYKESLDSVNSATLEGLTNSEKELQRFRELTAQAQNLNVSDKNRLAAVNELQKQYPQYLGNLTKEQILTGQVGDSYDLLTKQIIANAKAKAFSDEVTQNSKDLRTLEKQQIDTANQILAKRLELEKALLVSTQSAQKVAGQLAATDLTVSNIQAELNSLIQAQIVSINEANKIKQTNLELDTLINKELQNGAVFTKESIVNTEKQTKANVELKRTYEDLTGLETILKRAQLERLDAFSQGVEAPMSLSSGRAETQGIIIPEAIPNQLNDQALTFNSNLQTIGETIQELTAGFGGLGAIIGGAFGNNPKLGQFIAQFVGFAAKLIATNFKIAASNAVAGASQAAAATGPAAPLTLPAFIAGALGLVAAAFAAFGGGGKKGSAGGGGGGGMGGSGVGGGSQFTGTGAQGGMFATQKDLNGELVVRGQDLVYVFGQANNRINKG